MLREETWLVSPISGVMEGGGGHQETSILSSKQACNLKLTSCTIYGTILQAHNLAVLPLDFFFLARYLNHRGKYIFSDRGVGRLSNLLSIIKSTKWTYKCEAMLLGPLS